MWLLFFIILSSILSSPAELLLSGVRNEHDSFMCVVTAGPHFLHTSPLTLNFESLITTNPLKDAEKNAVSVSLLKPEGAKLV